MYPTPFQKVVLKCFFPCSSINYYILLPLYNKLGILKRAGYPDSPITETMILIFSINLINSILKTVLF